MIKLNLLGFLTSLIISNSSFAGPVWQGSASFKIKPEMMGAFKKAVSKITVPTRKEKGCISYFGYQILDEQGNETNRFEFHEIWTSKEAMLIDHKDNTPHMKLFFQEIKIGEPDSYVESFEVQGKYVQLIK